MRRRHIAQENSSGIDLNDDGNDDEDNDDDDNDDDGTDIGGDRERDRDRDRDRDRERDRDDDERVCTLPPPVGSGHCPTFSSPINSTATV